jgi:hypothetical protein
MSIENSSSHLKRFTELAAKIDNRFITHPADDSRFLDASQNALTSALNARRSPLTSHSAWSDLQLPSIS